MATFKLKRGLSQKWKELNPILEAGEPGCELDTGKLKVGDGKTPWNNLPYVGVGDKDCVQSADLANYLEPYLKKNQIASGTILGTVMSSQKENQIQVLENGSMEVNSININKLIQNDGDILILDASH